VTTVVESPRAWRSERVAQLRAGVTLGFVPTMGALHAGHLSLVRRSRSENDRTLVSIFVNPTQFDDPGDFAGYARTLDADLVLLRDEGVDFVLLPTEDDLYPDRFRFRVTETASATELEGRTGPGTSTGS